MVTFNIENKKICGTGSIEHTLFKYHWKCNHRTILPFYHHIDLIMGGNFIQNTQTIWWWMAEGNNEKYIVSHVLPINAQYVWVCVHVCWRNHRNENGASAWKAHSNGCWPRGYLDTDDKEKKKKKYQFPIQYFDAFVKRQFLNTYFLSLFHFTISNWLHTSWREFQT